MTVASSTEHSKETGKPEACNSRSWFCAGKGQACIQRAVATLKPSSVCSTHPGRLVRGLTALAGHRPLLLPPSAASSQQLAAVTAATQNALQRKQPAGPAGPTSHLQAHIDTGTAQSAMLPGGALSGRSALPMMSEAVFLGHTTHSITACKAPARLLTLVDSTIPDTHAKAMECGHVWR